MNKETDCSDNELHDLIKVTPEESNVYDGADRFETCGFCNSMIIDCSC